MIYLLCWIVHWKLPTSRPKGNKYSISVNKWLRSYLKSLVFLLKSNILYLVPNYSAHKITHYDGISIRIPVDTRSTRNIITYFISQFIHIDIRSSVLRLLRIYDGTVTPLRCSRRDVPRIWLCAVRLLKAVGLFAASLGMMMVLP